VFTAHQALQAIAQIAQNEGINPKNCISTGDIIGYCAQPEKRFSFLKIGMPRIG
jgi:hypothetical protein